MLPLLVSILSSKIFGFIISISKLSNSSKSDDLFLKVLSLIEEFLLDLSEFLFVLILELFIEFLLLILLLFE